MGSPTRSARGGSARGSPVRGHKVGQRPRNATGFNPHRFSPGQKEIGVKSGEEKKADTPTATDQSLYQEGSPTPAAAGGSPAAGGTPATTTTRRKERKEEDMKDESPTWWPKRDPTIVTKEHPLGLPSWVHCLNASSGRDPDSGAPRVFAGGRVITAVGPFSSSHWQKEFDEEEENNPLDEVQSQHNFSQLEELWGHKGLSREEAMYLSTARSSQEPVGWDGSPLRHAPHTLRGIRVLPYTKVPYDWAEDAAPNLSNARVKPNASPLGLGSHLMRARARQVQRPALYQPSYDRWASGLSC